MMVLRWLPLIALFIAGCSSNGLVRPGSVQVDGLQLRPGTAWTQRGVKGERQWTIDGPQLNALEIYTGIKDGDFIFDLDQRNKRGEGLRYRASMNALELQELIVAGLREAGAIDPESIRLAPREVGDLPGFELELRFANAQGLHYRALGLGFVADQRLQFLLYYAPAEYYFERERREIESLFASLRWTKG